MEKAGDPAPSADTAEISIALKIAFPLLMALPGFLYGLWLLKKIGRREKEEFISA